jgi:hypothetical protein
LRALLTLLMQGCGHELYADFKVFNEVVNELAAILQLPISSSSCTNGSYNINELHGIQGPRPAHLTSRTLPSSTDSSSGSSFSTLLGSTSSMTSNNSSSLSRQAYLELCINTGEYTKTLREIDLRNVGCDGELFKEIRNEYSRARNFKSRFWLLKPSGVHFVRVSICPTNGNVHLLICPPHSLQLKTRSVSASYRSHIQSHHNAKLTQSTTPTPHVLYKMTLPYHKTRSSTTSLALLPTRNLLGCLVCRRSSILVSCALLAL